MSDSQVKGIPEDLQQLYFYASLGNPSDADFRCEIPALIERIARSEQALAELQTQLSQEKERNTKASEIITARGRLLDQWNEKLDGLRKELAQKEQGLAASRARVGELEKALREMIDERYSEFDMMSCEFPRGSGEARAWEDGVQQAWKLWALSKKPGLAALAVPDGQKEK